MPTTRHKLRKYQKLLQHYAIPRCYAWEKLLTGCQALGKFCGRIDRISEQISKIAKNKTNSYFYLSGEEGSKKFKGDVFEIFVELLIRLSPMDDRIGISDYHVTEEGTDSGVDGYGIARDGTPATVQVKYRLWDDEIHVIAGHLENFRRISDIRHKVDLQSFGKMLIITTGQHVHWKTLDKHFSGKVKCISRNESYGCLRGAQSHNIDSLFSLKTLVDDHVHFWDTFRREVL